ncbi:MAG: BolA/IbaG family iron-sulfur metabolism protein [Bdellovibrionota bacterium]
MSILNSIEEKIKSNLHPTHLKVENESHLHSVPKGSETHFKIEVVTLHFEKKKLLERHRMVNGVIADEISKIRACALHTFTPAEWEIRKNEDFNSPNCAGGSKIK